MTLGPYTFPRYQRVGGPSAPRVSVRRENRKTDLTSRSRRTAELYRRWRCLRRSYRNLPASRRPAANPGSGPVSMLWRIQSASPYLRLIVNKLVARLLSLPLISYLGFFT